MPQTKATKRWYKHVVRDRRSNKDVTNERDGRDGGGREGREERKEARER